MEGRQLLCLVYARPRSREAQAAIGGLEAWLAERYPDMFEGAHEGSGDRALSLRAPSADALYWGVLPRLDSVGYPCRVYRRYGPEGEAGAQACWTSYTPPGRRGPAR